MNEPQGKTQWHRILGMLFELLFEALEVTVKVDFKLMSDPPRADILLLRCDTPTWTTEQLARLPDGIRDSYASHILIEFKYTESLNARRIEKAFGYDILYREVQGLPDKAVQTVILSAKTPRHPLLATYGYQPTMWAGVYQSEQVMTKRVMLIVLNELSNAPHNAYVKCFASRRQAKEMAFNRLQEVKFQQFSNNFLSFISGLHQLMLPQGERLMKNLEITPEDVMAWGKGWRAALLATIPVEERLRGLKPEDRLYGLKPEDRLYGLKPEERLRGLNPKDVLSQYKPYLEEQERQTIIRAIQRTLRVRFKLSPEQLEALEPPMQHLTVADLENLSEVALIAETTAEFNTALENEAES